MKNVILILLLNVLFGICNAQDHYLKLEIVQAIEEVRLNHENYFSSTNPDQRFEETSKLGDCLSEAIDEFNQKNYSIARDYVHNGIGMIFPFDNETVSRPDFKLLYAYAKYFIEMKILIEYFDKYSNVDDFSEVYRWGFIYFGLKTDRTIYEMTGKCIEDSPNNCKYSGN